MTKKGYWSLGVVLWLVLVRDREGERADERPGRRQAVKDTIYFGLVQGLEEEWGYFSQAEIESSKPKTWEIPKKNLPYSGRRN